MRSRGGRRTVPAGPVAAVAVWAASPHRGTQLWLPAILATSTVQASNWSATGTDLHTLEKYLFNPVVRFALRLGFAPKAFALPEIAGRRGGLARRTPVGNGLAGNVF